MNYTIGGAQLFFSSSIAHEDLIATKSFETADHSLGNIVVAEINPEITFIDHWISVAGKRVKDKVVTNVVSIMIPFTFDEMNVANLETFFQGTAAASVIPVMQTTLDEGSAKLVVETAIGQDLVYNIPKCTIRPDGAMAMADEDWHTAPMTIEVLQYQTGDLAVASDTSNAYWVAAPFGAIDSNAR